MNKLQKIREEVEKQLNLLKRVAEKLKNGLITSGNVSHTSKVQDYTIENVVNNIKEIILQKELVSEDFEEALANEWKGYNDRGAATFDALEDNTQELAFAKGFYRGAKWQKEQIMKDAIDVEVKMGTDGYPYIPQIEAYDYNKDAPFVKEGDKLKVIVIREE